MGWFGLGGQAFGKQFGETPKGVAPHNAGLYARMSHGPRGGPNGMTPSLFTALQEGGVIPSNAGNAFGGVDKPLYGPAQAYLSSEYGSDPSMDSYSSDIRPGLGGMSPRKVEELNALVTSRGRLRRGGGGQR